MQFPDATQLVFTMVSDMSAGIEQSYLEDPKASLDGAMKESTHFIGACYGHNFDPSDTMSSFLYKVWVSRTRRNGASIFPKPRSLSPTTDALRENIKRAHFQACIWKAALQQDRPELDQLQFGLDIRRTIRCIFVQCHYQVELKLPLQINCSCSNGRPLLLTKIELFK